MTQSMQEGLAPGGPSIADIPKCIFLSVLVFIIVFK